MHENETAWPTAKSHPFTRRRRKNLAKCKLVSPNIDLMTHTLRYRPTKLLVFPTTCREALNLILNSLFRIPNCYARVVNVWLYRKNPLHVIELHDYRSRDQIPASIMYARVFMLFKYRRRAGQSTVLTFRDMVT